MMNNSDFRELILKQREKSTESKWSGKMLDYLYLVKENPNVCMFAPGRVYNMIMSYGTEPVDESLKTRGYEDLVKYNFFNDKIYGSLEAIHDLMKFLKASARRTETGKRILLMVGPVSSGKCLNGNTKIYNVDDGKFYTIKDVVDNKLQISVQSYSPDGIPIVERISKFYHNGKKKVYRLTLDNGSFIEATENHQMMTPGGKWVQLNELEIGEYIVNTREYLEPKTTIHIDNNIVKLYAYYMAEGGVGINGSVGFSNIDPVIINDFYECARNIEPDCTLKNYDKEGHVWSPTCKRGLGNKIIDFLKKWDIKGKLSIEKSIDNRIFNSNNENIQVFLGTIWSCDGYIDTKGYPSYSTSSKDFAEGIRNLLLRLGIQSHTIIKKTSRHDTYPISIFGQENLEKFYNLISPYIIGSGKKMERIELINMQRKMNISDIIPSEYIYPILKEEYSNNNIHVKTQGIRDHKHRIDYYAKQNIGREKLREIGEFANSQKLINISNNDFYYRKIQSIEFIGEEDVYDIEVPMNHNFVINGGIITHNSTISSLIKRGLEMDKEPKYAISGCPIHEEPLHLIPIAERAEWEERLGIKIEGHLCPMCQHMVDEHFTDNDGRMMWEDVPVEKIDFSEQRRVGIGTFVPSDPMNQDVSELIGRVNMSKITRYGETDPRAFQFNGELQVANGGMIEYIELLKCNSKLHNILITAAQEQLIKSPGFPQMYIDTLILGHTNFTEYDAFKTDKKNEALCDRMYTVVVPWNLRVDDEIKIYEKMIDKSDFKNIHIAPNTLKVAAQFAVLSRLVPSTRISSLVEKMKIYNGELTEEMKKQEVDLKALREEGRVKGEGTVGISPRFIINALNVALGMKEDKKCVNPIDIIRALKSNFDHHIGITPEEKEKYITMLIGEKDSVSYEYKMIARKEVNMAFLTAYDEQAQSLFENYIMNASAFCKKEKVLDSITGEYSDPDEKLMRQIEEFISVPVNSKMEFRQNIFVYKSTRLEKGLPFTFKDYDPLRTAIEKKLMGDLKNIVSLSIADRSATDAKTMKRRQTAVKKMMEHGYCEQCASQVLGFVGELLRRSE